METMETMENTRLVDEEKGGNSQGWDGYAYDDGF